jgi:hypothetical protein
MKKIKYTLQKYLNFCEKNTAINGDYLLPFPLNMMHKTH